MSYYPTIKGLHITSVVFNIGFFSLRYFWMIRDSPMLSRKWPSRVSVLNDSFLLAFGVSLVAMSTQNPFQSPWLMAKLIGLVMYASFGTIAIKRGSNKLVRIAMGMISLLIAVYIVCVAINHSPSIPIMYGHYKQALSN